MKHRNNAPVDTPEEYYRRNIFLPFLNHVTTSLRDKFKTHEKLIVSLEKIIPSKCVKSNAADVMPLVEFYNKLLPEPTTLVSEFSVWKENWMKEEPSSRPHNALDAFITCNSVFFPNIKKLLQIFTSLPVSTATPERSFSTLKRLKSYLRNSTNQNRLTGLALLSVHRDISLDEDSVVDQFFKVSRRTLKGHHSSSDE